jgi:hypothetical protein
MIPQTINMIEPLTTSEINKLKKMVLGYGRLRYHAAKAGVHENTLRNIIANGRGLSDSVQKIRLNLLNDTSKAA